MQIIKRISNNAALALDHFGNEVAVLGKGIGFPDMPYELTDIAKVDRTFYDIDPRYLEVFAGLPEQILMASADIVEQAEINMDCDLNPNLPVTLADHLHFAMERINRGIDLTTPLAYDVEHLYPEEYELGLLALDIVEDYMKVRLPESEAVNVALHLINSENETGDIHSVLMTLDVISEVDAIVERELGIRLQKDSYSYNRFAMHLRYLIQRLASGKQVQENGGDMLDAMTREYPQIYLCARKVADHLWESRKWKCNREEIFYLMLHIHRVCDKSK